MGSLYSYKMTHDHGFAPNPYHGFLTLATCMSGIRKQRIKGEWVAGWTGCGAFKLKRGNEKLIYLMRISEKTTMDKYFFDPRFKKKRPKKNSDILEESQGDNIYEFIGTDFESLSDWKPHPRNYHLEKGLIERDLKNKSVLIAKEFYYFGEKAIDVEGNCRPNVPYGQTNYGVKTESQELITAFVEFVKAEHARLRSMPLPNHPEIEKDDDCNSTCGSKPKKAKKNVGCGSGC